jgi:hypothetical protein
VRTEASSERKNERNELDSNFGDLLFHSISRFPREYLFIAKSLRRCAAPAPCFTRYIRLLRTILSVVVFLMLLLGAFCFRFCYPPLSVVN